MDSSFGNSKGAYSTIGRAFLVTFCHTMYIEQRSIAGVAMRVNLTPTVYCRITSKVALQLTRNI